MATVFIIARSRGADVIRKMPGETYRNVLTSDRWTAYMRIKHRQSCWVHLRPDFQAMIDRCNLGTNMGKSRLMLSDQVFHWWHRVRGWHPGAIHVSEVHRAPATGGTRGSGPERTLPHAVLWRKSSGGTDSEAGSRGPAGRLSGQRRDAFTASTTWGTKTPLIPSRRVRFPAAQRKTL